MVVFIAKSGFVQGFIIKASPLLPLLALQLRPHTLLLATQFGFEFLLGQLVNPPLKS